MTQKVLTGLLAAMALWAPPGGFTQTLTASPAGREVASEDEAFLKAMAASLSARGTLASRFVQRRKLTLFEDTLVSEGTFAFQPPDLLRWQLTKPYFSILIFNRGKVVKFEAAPAGGVTQVAMGGAELFSEVLRKVMDVLRGDVKALGEDYVLSTAPMEGGRCVVMKPRSQALSRYVQEMRLSVEARTFRVTEVTILEGGGDEVLLTFSEAKEGKVLDPGLFDLTHPTP